LAPSFLNSIGSIGAIIGDLLVVLFRKKNYKKLKKETAKVGLKKEIAKVGCKNRIAKVGFKNRIAKYYF
jgi:hypothetical protein